MTMVDIYLRDLAVFEEGRLDFLYTRMYCIGEHDCLPSVFSESGRRNTFRIYLSFGVDVGFVFETESMAMQARRTLIKDLQSFWGADNILYNNGSAHNVVLIPAIDTVSDVFFKQNDCAGFYVTVKCVSYPLLFTFGDVKTAYVNRLYIDYKVEQHRRQSAFDHPVDEAA